MSHSQEFASSRLKLMGGVGLALVIFLMWIEGAFVSKASPGTQPEPHAVAGSTLTLHRQTAEGPISWPARVEALKTIQVAAKFPGRILEIQVTAGSKVTRGQKLARLESAELSARLAQAKAQLVASEAAAARSAADALRIRHLYEKEAATRQTLDTSVAEERQTQAKVQEARAAVSQMESEVSETILVAPFDGVVERRLLEPGDMVLPGQAILTFLQFPILRIEASIPSTCAGSVQVGDSVTAQLPDTSATLTAIVEEKEPASDRETQTQRIKARLPADTQILPGSFVWLQQPCGTESLMLIPATAIRRIGQLQTVSIMKDGQPRLRHIRTGRLIGDNVEVLSGLSEGDELMVGAP
jgi:RND family efflux transporter MFP subunit